MRHQTYDWYRKVRKLCPKQRPQKIQMYDDHGQSLNPHLELQRIEEFFGQFFLDTSFQYPGKVALQTLPFTQEDVLQGLQDLPIMKVLAPPCMPALIWRHLAGSLRVRSMLPLNIIGVQNKWHHPITGLQAGCT